MITKTLVEFYNLADVTMVFGLPLTGKRKARGGRLRGSPTLVDLPWQVWVCLL